MNKIEKQILEAKPLTEERLKKFYKEPFTSGRLIQVGDKVLYGFVDNGKEHLDFISLHEEEFNTLYELSEINRTTSDYPELKIKK